MISSSFWFTLFETLLYIHYHIRVILVLLWLHIHTSNCKITTCYTPIQASSLYSHIYTHIHILYTKSHIQSRNQDLQQTNFPFPLSTIMDRLPATHIIYLSILIFLEIVQKVLSSNLLRFYSCLFYYLLINMPLLEINYYYQKPTTC